MQTLLEYLKDPAGKNTRVSTYPVLAFGLANLDCLLVRASSRITQNRSFLFRIGIV